MGDKNQPQVIGALRRLHFGPGPHPSGSDQDVHAGDGKRIEGNTAEEWEMFLLDKYGEANWRSASWIGPSGKYLAPNVDHQIVAFELLGPEANELSETEATNIAVKRGMIRVNIQRSFLRAGSKEVFFDTPKFNKVTDKQRDAMALIITMAEREFGRLGGAVINVGGTFGKPPEFRTIFDEDVYEFLELDWRDPLERRAIMPDHEIDVDEIDHGWSSAFKDEGIYTTPVEPIDGIIALPIGALGLSSKELVSPDDENGPESENEKNEEEIEKKSLMADIRRSLTELIAAIRRDDGIQAETDVEAEETPDQDGLELGEEEEIPALDQEKGESERELVESEIIPEIEKEEIVEDDSIDSDEFVEEEDAAPSESEEVEEVDSEESSAV